MVYFTHDVSSQKLQFQLLQGRTGGAVESVRVGDERVENVGWISSTVAGT